MKLPDNPPQEVLYALTEAGLAAQCITAYPGTQRHRSWRVSTDDGAIWIKLEAQVSPVAGIEREALILRSLRRHFFHIPDVVISGRDSLGRPYLVTTELPGISLGDGYPGRAWIPAVVSAIQVFGANESHLPAAARWRGPDVFGDQPHLATLLREAAAEVDDELTYLAARIAENTTPEPVVLVHGSLDPDNVIVKGAQLSGLLDLEATRLGPSSYDVASMTTGLAIDAGIGPALDWLATCEQAIPQTNLPNVCGFMLLRACFRQAIGALSPSEKSSILEVTAALGLAS